MSLRKITIIHFVSRFTHIFILQSQDRNKINSFITKKQTTKFSSANFQNKIKFKLYHIEKSKTRGQIV